MCADGMDRSGLPITDNDAVRGVSEELRRNARLARWFGLGLVFVGVTAMLVAAAGTLYVGAGVRELLEDRIAAAERQEQEAQREVRLVGDIMGCILGQFAEHRQASREYFTMRLRHEGQPPLTTAEPEAVDHAAVKEYCNRARGAFEPPPNPVPTQPGG